MLDFQKSYSNDNIDCVTFLSDYILKLFQTINEIHESRRFDDDFVTRYVHFLYDILDYSRIRFSEFDTYINQILQERRIKDARTLNDIESYIDKIVLEKA